MPGRRIAGEIPEAPQQSTELVLFEVSVSVFVTRRRAQCEQSRQQS